MKYSVLILIIGCFFSCVKVEKGNLSSVNASDFEIVLGEDVNTDNWISEGILEASDCEVAIETIAGKKAIKVTTTAEFSDALINLEKLFEHSIDFYGANYATLEVFLPEDSYISALKFNYADAKGNFGGCQEMVNNFENAKGTWRTYKIDLKKALKECSVWSGDEDPIGNAIKLSLNPYNPHQASPSSIYVHAIKISKVEPEGEYVEPLLPRPDTTATPFLLDFNDTPYFRKVLAYRGFETSYQALGTGIGGNETQAVRIKNENGSSRKFTCFLPEFLKLTGYPVDFTQVKKFYFSYYVTPESDDFDGANLFLTSHKWKEVLLDDHFYDDFKKGEWHKVEIFIDDLDLIQVQGEESPLAEITDLRIDLNYRPDAKNIEMWIDDFGWE